jgi:anti-sigma regulatory factor (Ser/Thr protein kinase)
MSPSRARHLIRDFTDARTADASLADDAMLLVSEVVANVVRHAGTGMTITAEAAPHRLRVEVEDESPVLPEPLPFDRADPRESGRGLVIVERVARAWGIERRPSGKVVWFEVASGA